MPVANMAEYMATRRKRRREELIALSGGCCARCGSSDCLEFNHKDRTTVGFRLNGCDLDTSWTKILEEWKKCELLCKIHHLEYTAQQYKNKEIVPWNKDNSEYRHGSMRTYLGLKCRCVLCRKAKKYYTAKSITFSEVIDC